MGRSKMGGQTKVVGGVLRSIRAAKAHATGRVFDELHFAEGRLERAAAGRKSTFTATERKRKKGKRAKKA
jgi:hypothetical protein